MTTKFNIVIAYRPLSSSGMNSPRSSIIQNDDMSWSFIDDNGISTKRYGMRFNENKDDLERAISFINNNSSSTHNIIVVTDEDVFPHKNYLKQYTNVKILKSGYHHEGILYDYTVSKVNAAIIKGINEVPDDEWVLYGYLSDVICPKNWDIPIIESIKQYGDNHVYVPVFVEIRGALGNKVFVGAEMTPYRIWYEWRNEVMCHALILPEPECHYFTCDDIRRFIDTANQFNMPQTIIEKPGLRNYGYYVMLITKSKYAKKAMRQIGYGFDTDYDTRLYTECGLMKCVVTRSFLFHPYCEFKNIVDNVKVKDIVDNVKVKC